VAAAEAPRTGLAALRVVWLGALVGVPAALVAAGFLAFVHDLEHWLWHDLPSKLGSSTPQWYLVVGLPVAGACVVLAARALPGDGGHRPLLGIGGGAVPVSHAPSIALAAIGTLGFGAVLGPEAPLIALGSATGVAVCRLATVTEQERLVVATAGSFSAISALFGGPIVGGVMMTEATAGLGLGAATSSLLLPGFVAAALGYVLFVGFGSWGGLNAQGLATPGLPTYTHIHLGDLVLAIVVGLAAAAVMTLVRELGGRVEQREPLVGRPALLLAGGLAVGLLAELADALGANSQDVLFSGQSSIPSLVASGSTKIVLILLVAKGLAYAVSLGCGFRGGPVFPAIFLGVALATLSIVWFDVSPTLAIAVGAAAGMAAATRLLLTSMLFAELLDGSAGINAVPAAVLAATAAWLAMKVIDEMRANRTAQPASAT
jgi:H+/Cl- antiporter ClcA